MSSNILYCDGCCNSKIGSCSYVCDENKNDCIRSYYPFLQNFEFFNDFEKIEINGKILLKVDFTDVKSQQNNGAELLAFVIACCIGCYFNYNLIRCDSQLIVDSWSKKESKTIKCQKKAKLQRFCVMIASEFRKKGVIEWIPSKSNYADLKPSKI